tara:strand:+ start:437 stop:907 length:471 start_codon:yes stop_codon:yes gene_type:complete
MIKSIKFFLILLVLSNCGYSPIYEVNQQLNIRLDTITYSGDKNIRREIEKGLEKFKNNQTKNVFDAKIDISKKQEIVTKDKKGDPSSFKIIMEVNLNLENKENNKKFSKMFVRETTFDSMDNKFELDQYKNNIEKNMIFKILQDINIFFNIIENDL